MSLNPITDFDKYFPTLMAEIAKLQTTAEISMMQKSTQHVSNKTLLKDITSFYDDIMQPIVERVSPEI